MSTINRHEFFAAFRQLIDTENAHETRIFPDRIEVCRFVRGEDGKILVDGAGNLYHVVETHWLVSPDGTDEPVGNSSD